MVVLQLASHREWFQGTTNQLFYHVQGLVRSQEICTQVSRKMYKRNPRWNNFILIIQNLLPWCTHSNQTIYFPALNLYRLSPIYAEIPLQEQSRQHRILPYPIKTYNPSWYDRRVPHLAWSPGQDRVFIWSEKHNEAGR